MCGSSFCPCVVRVPFRLNNSCIITAVGSTEVRARLEAVKRNNMAKLDVLAVLDKVQTRFSWCAIFLKKEECLSTDGLVLVFDFVYFILVVFTWTRFRQEVPSPLFSISKWCCVCTNWAPPRMVKNLLNTCS